MKQVSNKPESPVFFLNMVIIASITGLIAGLYLFLIIRLARGWRSIPEVSTRNDPRNRLFISVIIPFRNESQNIPGIIHNLRDQSFSKHHLEVIMVNDHSSDEGIQILKELQKKHAWLQVITSTGQGKKEALKNGISAATGELIITTDADCRFGKDWLQTIAENYFLTEPDMMVMPVAVVQQNTLFSYFQQLDYLALQMATAGAFGIKSPIMCSGANLAFRKKSYIEVWHQIPGSHYLSGDDMFLLQAFKMQNFKICYLKSAQAIAHTWPASSFSDFFHQRIRWGHKTPAYQDKMAQKTAIIVFVANAWPVILLAFSYLSLNILFFGIIFLILKIAADYNLLNAGNRFFSVRLRPFRFLLFSILYPFYITAAGTGSLFSKEKWKERTGS